MFRELRPGTRNGDERERRPKTVWNVDSMLPEPEDGSKKIQAGHTSVNASRASAAGGQHRRQGLWTLATRQHEAARSTPGPCASALARPPSPARRLPPPLSAAAQPCARPRGAGGNHAPRDGSTRSAARPRPRPARPWRVSFASAVAAAMEFDSVGPSSFGVLTADG